MTISFDDYDQRHKRYKIALDARQLKLFLFEQAYKFSLPGRNKWLTKTSAVDKTNWRWDTTAVEGLQTFSSNLQQMLLPPFQDWIKLVPGTNENPAFKNRLDKYLEDSTKTLLNVLNGSNLGLEMSIAFQDMGISVGLLQIESTKSLSTPLRFHAVPLHECALEEYNGKIESVWREFEVPVRDINTLWEDSKLSEPLQRLLSTSPEHKVKLVEGTIYYPNNPPHQRYLYYVADEKSNTDLVRREMEISPWIPFRFSVSPGEIWGFGPVLQILDQIRIANMMAEFEIRNAGYRISRPLFIKADQILNPHTVKIEPGAMIRVRDISQPPIVPMDIGGDLQFDQLSLKAIQDNIRKILFADPLPDQTASNTSATEISIRQNNWIKRSSASFGRLNNELMRPLVSKSLYFLREKGILTNLNIGSTSIELELDGNNIDVEFVSPVANVQNQEDIQSFQEYATTLVNLLTPQGTLGALNIQFVPEYLAKKFNIPLNLVKSASEIESIVSNLTNGQGAPQPPQGVSPQGVAPPDVSSFPSEGGAPTPTVNSQFSVIGNQ